MNIHPLFCSFIAVEENLNLDNSVLEEYCKNYAKGNTQTDYLNITDAELQPLIEKINFLSNQVAENIGLKQGQKVTKAWANLNSNPAIVQPHSHTKAVFSCVYYVKGSIDSGDITFITPLDILDYVFDRDRIETHTDFNTSELSLPPLSGSLIMFPAWLKHYVKPSTSERISIAFNINYA